jgi:phosphatidate cytidylyltransferase
MLKLRLITAAVGIPLLSALLIWGSVDMFRVVMVVLAVMGSVEAFAIVRPELERALAKGPDTQVIEKWPEYVTAGLAALLFFGASTSQFESLPAVLTTIFFLPFFIFIFGTENNMIALSRVFSCTLSLVYGVLPWLCVLSLFRMDPLYVWLLLGIVWGGDTGAYFGGKQWGRRKLIARLSPNKTVEGALAGLISSVVFAVLIASWIGGKFSVVDSIILGCVGGVAGQLGDLIESSMKRFGDVKDSGTLLPGHGGVLDRFDGIIFASPILWLLIFLLSAPGV